MMRTTKSPIIRAIQILILDSSLSTSKSKDSDTTFDAIYDSVAGLLNSTNSYVQKAQQAEIDYALGNIFACSGLNSF